MNIKTKLNFLNHNKLKVNLEVEHLFMCEINCCNLFCLCLILTFMCDINCCNNM